MARRYSTAILLILLSGVLLAIQGAIGFSEASRTPAAHRSYSHVKVHRAPQKLVLRSASAFVEDQQTGECLVQKQAEAVLPIASITKLMTAMVVLDAKMNLQESLTILPEDVDTLRHSRSRLPVGNRLTRGDALLLALMASENRAARALGRTYPGGLGAFVTAMNAKAQSLGLAETRFEDPTGISSGNVSSARDLARMVDAAYKYRLIREFTTRKEATIHTGYRSREFRNSNRLIRSPRWQIGLSKTGFIDEAGRCLVMQAHVAKRPVLIVLLDSQGKLSRYGDANRIKQWMEGPSAERRKHRG
jgi:D-alanyl-D-alanine endopeptidase (penicillin-binding protein 7)